MPSCQGSWLGWPDWPEHLPWVLLGYVPPPRRPQAYLQPSWSLGSLWFYLESCSGSYAAVAASNITIPKQLQEATYVYMRRGGTISPLAPVYSGRYRMLHVGPKVFQLEIGATQQTVSVDRLKPHTGQLPVTPAAPAKRGRPKK